MKKIYKEEAVQGRIYRISVPSEDESEPTMYQAFADPAYR